MTSQPKDLGIKIGTKEEAEWTKVKDTQEEVIRNSIISKEIAEVVLELCNKAIAREKQRLK